MVKTNVEIHFVTTLVVIRTQRPVDFSSNFPLFSTRTLRRKYEYKVVVGLEKADERTRKRKKISSSFLSKLTASHSSAIL